MSTDSSGQPTFILIFQGIYDMNDGLLRCIYWGYLLNDDQ